tara:strand:- start:630 stop:845 length:216 start_codon:yes stop_codon:yes gene_type:complete
MITAEDALQNIKDSDIEPGALWEKWEGLYQSLDRYAKTIKRAEERGLAPTTVLQGVERAAELVREFKEQII